MNHNQIATTVQGYPVRTGNGAPIPRRAQGIQALALWKNENPEAPDQWLRREIGMGFQQMVCLGLNGQPAAEMLPLAAEMWVMTIGYGMTEELDSERIRGGFAQLYRILTRWPQPVELLKVLPGRPKRPLTPEPERDPVDHAANAAKLQEIMDMLNKGETP